MASLLEGFFTFDLSLMQSLPPLTFNTDVFTHILMFIGTKDHDMTWLWTTCREVSRDFKDAVERVFITRHLKKTWLRVEGGEVSSLNRRRNYLTRFNLTFSTLPISLMI